MKATPPRKIESWVLRAEEELEEVEEGGGEACSEGGGGGRLFGRGVGGCEEAGCDDCSMNWGGDGGGGGSGGDEVEKIFWKKDILLRSNWRGG